MAQTNDSTKDNEVASESHEHDDSDAARGVATSPVTPCAPRVHSYRVYKTPFNKNTATTPPSRELR